MIVLLRLIVYAVSAGLTSFGFYLLCRSALRRLNQRIGVEQRIRERNREIKSRQLGGDSRPSVSERFLRDTDFLLQNTRKNYRKETAVQNFLLFQLTAFWIWTLLVTMLSRSLGFGLLVSGVILVSNYVLRHRLKLRLLRLERGYQLAGLIGAVASKYNAMLVPQMRPALQEVLDENPDSPFRRHLAEIVRVDQNYKLRSELETAIEAFYYGVGTSFAKEFGATALKALTTKENVGQTLQRMDGAIHRNMQDILKETSDKAEVRNLSLLHLIAFPGLFVAVYVALNVTGAGMLHYQFQTPQGQTWFVLSVSAIVAARIFSQWYARQPNDY